MNQPAKTFTDRSIPEHMAEIKRLSDEILTDDCEHENTEYFPAQPDRHDEPGNDEGYRCHVCGVWLEPEDAATRMGI